jgi:hypothetical protein
MTISGRHISTAVVDRRRMNLCRLRFADGFAAAPREAVQLWTVSTMPAP